MTTAKARRTSCLRVCLPMALPPCSWPTKKCVPTVKSYADITEALVNDTITAEKAHNIQVAVLGTYVELAINDARRLQNVADFKEPAGSLQSAGGRLHRHRNHQDVRPACGHHPRGGTGAALPQSGRDSAGCRGTGRDRGRGARDLSQHELRRRPRHILDTMRSPNLKVIFDLSNLVDADNVNAQDHIWNDIGELVGDKIVAVHFKGAGVQRRTAACCTPVWRTA